MSERSKETEETKPRTVRLATAQDVRKLLSKVINQHRQGDLPDGKARVQGYLLGTLLKAISDTETAERIDELEQAVQEINGRKGVEHYGL